ncbi:MAG: division/cell wall cluster transcriptional repressor MraZ [Marinobacter sp.]|uniref:division/cell wall cluster transcriptional repressor MraZ n=1 Tax=Marinobacter sp. TaxID=50741 RepID=UPI003F96D830
MTKQDPFRKVGSAYRVELRQLPDKGNFLLDRISVSTFSSELKTLIEGPLAITASPDRPALLVYSELKWDELRPKIEALPNSSQEARRFKRITLGNVSSLDGYEPVAIPQTLAKHAFLGTSVILISFDDFSAEIWDEQHLIDFSG